MSSLQGKTWVKRFVTCKGLTFILVINNQAKLPLAITDYALSHPSDLVPSSTSHSFSPSVPLQQREEVRE